ncbi:hypothetical protein BD324DRAFT_652167 [Kockovaella imperatae]|uniref:Uncharacterized protein n=1 Tax=Kockovaella imperatae TaxID=4999 RepID=A0A1Y1UDI9_9TREE|nr:hypothetical protein BD324DRAFT_652167 [Kockovaella imperatae]ORX35617.1 hypothetical protein BD324DRAFT_652167 [Kockovaella imperatae]
MSYQDQEALRRADRRAQALSKFTQAWNESLGRLATRDDYEGYSAALARDDLYAQFLKNEEYVRLIQDETYKADCSLWSFQHETQLDTASTKCSAMKSRAVLQSSHKGQHETMMSGVSPSWVLVDQSPLAVWLNSVHVWEGSWSQTHSHEGSSSEIQSRAAKTAFESAWDSALSKSKEIGPDSITQHKIAAVHDCETDVPDVVSHLYLSFRTPARNNYDDGWRTFKSEPTVWSRDSRKNVTQDGDYSDIDADDDGENDRRVDSSRTSAAGGDNGWTKAQAAQTPQEVLGESWNSGTQSATPTDFAV